MNAAVSELEGAAANLQDILDELQEKFDGRSEKWQESEKGEEAQAELDVLQEAIRELESAASTAGSALSELE